MTHAPFAFHTGHITQNIFLGEGSYVLRIQPLQPFSFKAGQHLQLRFSDPEGTFLRYFSIANAPRESGELEFYIQALEERLARCLPTVNTGSEVLFSDARGLFRVNDPAKPIVLIAGGTGIAPLRAFFEQLTGGFALKERAAPLALLYGSRHTQIVPGKDDFLKFHHASLATIKVCLMAEHGSDALMERGRVTDHLEKFLVPGADYYLCGPPRMLDAVRSFLTERGIPETAIYQERYA